MSIKAKVDVSVIYHDATSATFSVGALADNLLSDVATAQTFTGTVGTSAVQIVGQGNASTVAIKNTGTNVLRVAGSLDVSAGRLAVLPVTAAVSVAAAAGNGSYTAIWVGQ